MSQQPTIETERLILRPFGPSDAKRVQELAGDRAISDTTLGIPHPYLDGMAEDWISKHQISFDEGKGVHFAVTEKSDHALIGAVSLMFVVKGHQAELGYWIGKRYWNMGYCTEAAQVAIRYGFEELGLIRVHASYLARNLASGRVMQKLGMVHEGCRRQHISRWGKLEDLGFYGLLIDEWRGQQTEPVKKRNGRQ